MHEIGELFSNHVIVIYEGYGFTVYQKTAQNA